MSKSPGAGADAGTEAAPGQDHQLEPLQEQKVEQEQTQEQKPLQEQDQTQEQTQDQTHQLKPLQGKTTSKTICSSFGKILTQKTQMWRNIMKHELKQPNNLKPGRASALSDSVKMKKQQQQKNGPKISSWINWMRPTGEKSETHLGCPSNGHPSPNVHTSMAIVMSLLNSLWRAGLTSRASISEALSMFVGVGLAIQICQVTVKSTVTCAY
tara:strand:+ start:152 stop:784 length:633 start_codon:yes stop_codon:yes gene_type:complete